MIWLLWEFGTNWTPLIEVSTNFMRELKIQYISHRSSCQMNNSHGKSIWQSLTTPGMVQDRDTLVSSLKVSVGSRAFNKPNKGNWEVENFHSTIAYDSDFDFVIVWLLNQRRKMKPWVFCCEILPWFHCQPATRFLRID